MALPHLPHLTKLFPRSTPAFVSDTLMRFSLDSSSGRCCSSWMRRDRIMKLGRLSDTTLFSLENLKRENKERRK